MSTLTQSGRLASLHRYPVKSMMGEELNAVRITPRGVFGDRAFALRDAETGKVVSARTPASGRTCFPIAPRTRLRPKLNRVCRRCASACPMARWRSAQATNSAASFPGHWAGLSV